MTDGSGDDAQQPPPPAPVAPAVPISDRGAIAPEQTERELAGSGLPEHVTVDGRAPITSGRPPATSEPLLIGPPTTVAAVEPDEEPAPQVQTGSEAEAGPARGSRVASQGLAEPDAPVEPGLPVEPEAHLQVEPEADPPAPPVVVSHLRGQFERYEIGDPGRAFANVVPRIDAQYFGVPDTRVDGVVIDGVGDVPRLVVRAASTRGLSHRHSSKVRQDDYAFTISTDGRYLIAIVADGVSSGPRSHLAAQIAVGRGCHAIVRELEREAVDDLEWLGFLAYLVQRMRKELTPAEDGDLTAHDIAAEMATTLVVAIIDIEPDSDGSHAVRTLRLGDTSAWLLGPGHQWQALGDVKNEGATIAESVTGGLPFVPAEAPPVTRTVLEPGRAFVLMTDGIGDPLGAGRGEVGATLAELWSTPPDLLAFAAQVEFGRKSFDDDRTALAVWIAEGMA